jgi:hypothetical protein
METATIIVILCQVLGITTYSVYTAFGPASKICVIRSKNMIK